MNQAQVAIVIKQWSSVMLAILSLIYREFCLARVAEMRRTGYQDANINL